MTGYPHLSNAPIVEGLLDFRVSRPATGLDGLNRFADAIKDSYPTPESVHRFAGRVSLARAEQPTVSAGEEEIGFRFRAAEPYVLMATVEGFTLSRLKPYQSWNELKAEALRLWAEYRRFVAPECVTRIALRYINRLELPVQLRDFADYLTAPPAVPPRLPQRIQGFLSRVVIALPESHATVAITQRMEQPQGEVLPVILDIDVFRVNEAIVPDADELWSVADRLRLEKNRIFFESITETMVAQCQ